jgi:hypothetical protein
MTTEMFKKPGKNYTPRMGGGRFELRELSILVVD